MTDEDRHQLAPCDDLLRDEDVPEGMYVWEEYCSCKAFCTWAGVASLSEIRRSPIRSNRSWAS